MKALQDRKLAIMITIIVAVLATSLGVYKTSAAYTKKIEAGFYNGVYLKDEGYTQPGINHHLDNCAAEALNLATVLGKYPGLSGKADSVLAARRELLDAGSIAAKQASYLTMASCVYDLTSAAKNVDLSENDIKALTGYSSIFSGALTAISGSVYNDTVTEYLDGRSPFMGTFSGIIPMKEPAYFELPDIQN